MYLVWLLDLNSSRGLDVCVEDLEFAEDITRPSCRPPCLQRRLPCPTPPPIPTPVSLGTKWPPIPQGVYGSRCRSAVRSAGESSVESGKIPPTEWSIPLRPIIGWETGAFGTMSRWLRFARSAGESSCSLSPPPHSAAQSRCVEEVFCLHLSGLSICQSG